DKNICKYISLHLIEQEWNKDDMLEERYIEQKTNRTDGMRLISPELSEKWAKELGLDWIPSQWIIRQNFIKGMVCTFPFREFAEEINHGNYEVNTVYTDTHGRPIKADLREVDLILTESQFKLWEGFASIESYVDNCHKNKLNWGVAQYSPKKNKETLTLNYQFIQTLNKLVIQRQGFFILLGAILCHSPV